MAQPSKNRKRVQVAFIALGANLPWAGAGPEKTLEMALSDLDSDGDRVIAKSRIYATPCFPAGAGPDYFNATVMLETSRAPDALMGRLGRIETVYGRERDRRWGSRTLDLDLLAVGETVLPDLQGFRDWAGLAPDAQRTVSPDRLILPHPRMQERAFVLVPLAEIAADWRHPVFGRTVAEMLADLPPADIGAVEAL